MTIHDALTAYFNGEQHAGLFLAGIGACILAAAAILVQARWGLRSFAVTLAVFGLVEIAIGIGLYVKTGPQVGALVTQLGSDTAGTLSAETARMTTVQRNFVLLEYLWLSLLPSAAIAAVALKQRPWLSGIALGVICHVAVFLAFDLTAERRGASYLTALQSQTAPR